MINTGYPYLEAGFLSVEVDLLFVTTACSRLIDQLKTSNMTQLDKWLFHEWLQNRIICILKATSFLVFASNEAED